MRALVATVLAVALPAAAQAREGQEDWAAGPAGVLLTDAERAAWAATPSGPEAELFIEQFWARRDPDPATAVNEARVDHEARVHAADLQFGEDGVRGALTDRGKVLVLIGLPSRRQTGSIEDYLARLYRDPPPDDGAHRNRYLVEEDDLKYRARNQLGMPTLGIGDDLSTDSKARQEGKVEDWTTSHGVRFQRDAGKVDVWVYSRSDLSSTVGLWRPQEVELAEPPDEVEFVFFDLDGSGSYQLQRTLKGSEESLRVLGAAVVATAGAPAGVPARHVVVTGAEAATARELGWLDDGTARWPEGAVATLVRGAAGRRVHPAWVFVCLPDATPTVDLAIGRLRWPDGSVAGSFRRAVSPLGTAEGSVVELSLEHAPAGAVLELALVAADRPVAETVLAVADPPPAPEAAFLTTVMAGAEVFVEDSPAPGAPFVFGGYHVVLRPSGRYRADENLTYFCLFTDSGEQAGAAPEVTVAMALYRQGQGRPLFATPARMAQASPVAPGVAMFGSELPLSSLPGPGSYRFEVTVQEAGTGVERSTALPVVLE